MTAHYVDAADVLRCRESDGAAVEGGCWCPPSVPRSSALDKLRGLAVLLMVCDHVAVVLEAGGLWRYSFTRAAMPLFFVLGGALVRRWAWKRWGALLGVGFGLELVAPWAGPFELLLGFVYGAVCVLLFRRLGALWLLVLVPIVLLANGFGGITSTGGYDVYALMGLMAAGALMGRELLERLGAPLPRPLELLGRYPLSVYAAHLVVLEGVRLWLS